MTICNDVKFSIFPTPTFLPNLPLVLLPPSLPKFRDSPRGDGEAGFTPLGEADKGVNANVGLDLLNIPIVSLPPSLPKFRDSPRGEGARKGGK